MPTDGESQLSLVGLQRHGVGPISGLSEQGLERSAPRETEASGCWPDLGSLQVLWEAELQD